MFKEWREETKRNHFEFLAPEWDFQEALETESCRPRPDLHRNQPKAKWLWGCLSERYWTVWVSNQKHIPACKHHLSTNQLISLCVRWVDILSVLTWHVLSLLFWKRPHRDTMLVWLLLSSVLKLNTVNSESVQTPSLVKITMF